MRNKDIEDVDPKEKSLNYAKKYDYWLDPKPNNKNELALRVMQKKIKGSIGLKWNDVYSKLKKEFPAKLHSYIKYYVEENCTEKNGEIFDSAGKTMTQYGNWGKVCVVNGILKSAPRVKWPKRKPVPQWVIVENRCYTTFDGLWFELIFKPWSQELIDIFEKVPMSKEWCRKKYGREIICVNKRQCNKKTIRRLVQSLTKKG